VGRQGDYYNTVVRVETSLHPVELLHTLLAIEASLGRVRNRPRGPRGESFPGWEARNIDIDLLLYENVVYHDDALTIPHPRLHERRFVVEPLAEIAGELLHPVQGITIDSIARTLAEPAPEGDIIRVFGPEWALRDSG